MSHEHSIQTIAQTSEYSVLYGCDCGLEFEEGIIAMVEVEEVIE